MEAIISKAILETFFKEFKEYLEVDVAIAGCGPSGLVCGYYLAKEKIKVAIFERQLRPGGGIAGGGMMFNKIVLEESAKEILEELDINVKKYKKNLYVADALEVTNGLCFKAIKVGVKIFNLINVEDVVIRKNKIAGLVLNWSAVNWAKLHIDPLAVKAKVVVDATGHEAEICKIIERKLGAVLCTSSGKVEGEKSMWAEKGESELLKNTKEVYPGLVICGMAANAVFGAERMGAIFGGMFLSGKKASRIIIKKLKKDG